MTEGVWGLGRLVAWELRRFREGGTRPVEDLQHRFGIHEAVPPGVNGVEDAGALHKGGGHEGHHNQNAPLSNGDQR